MPASNSIADISEVLLELGLSGTCTETEAALAQVSLTKAHGCVRRCLGYDPVQATRTEYYPQMDLSQQGANEGVWEVNGSQAYVRQVSEAATTELQVGHVPIRSITSLYIDYDGRSGTKAGAFGVASLKVEGVDFWPNYTLLDSSGNKVCKDGIIRSQGLWGMTPGSIKLTYVAGYSDAELHGQDTVIDASPILEVVIDEAVNRFQKTYAKMKKRAGFTGPFSSESMGDYSYQIDTASLEKMISGSDISYSNSQKLADFIIVDLGVR